MCRWHTRFIQYIHGQRDIAVDMSTSNKANDRHTHTHTQCLQIRIFKGKYREKNVRRNHSIVDKEHKHDNNADEDDDDDNNNKSVWGERERERVGKWENRINNLVCFLPVKCIGECIQTKKNQNKRKRRKKRQRAHTKLQVIHTLGWLKSHQHWKYTFINMRDKCALCTGCSWVRPSHQVWLNERGASAAIMDAPKFRIIGILSHGAAENADRISFQCSLNSVC